MSDFFTNNNSHYQYKGKDSSGVDIYEYVTNTPTSTKGSNNLTVQDSVDTTGMNIESNSSSPLFRSGATVNLMDSSVDQLDNLYLGRKTFFL